MDLNKFAKEVHDNAVGHGWWENKPSFAEIIALCHSELSEALEEFREGKPDFYYDCYDIVCKGKDCFDCEEHKASIANGYTDKPEGIAVELADCILRILDYCAHAGIDIEEVLRIKHEYNKSRPYRHGGKVI